MDFGGAIRHYYDSSMALYMEGGIVLLLVVLGAYAYFGLRLFTTKLRTAARDAALESEVLERRRLRVFSAARRGLIAASTAEARDLHRG